MITDFQIFETKKRNTIQIKENSDSTLEIALVIENKDNNQYKDAIIFGYVEKKYVVFRRYITNVYYFTMFDDFNRISLTDLEHKYDIYDLYELFQIKLKEVSAFESYYEQMIEYLLESNEVQKQIRINKFKI